MSLASALILASIRAVAIGNGFAISSRITGINLGLVKKQLHVLG